MFKLQGGMRRNIPAHSARSAATASLQQTHYYRVSIILQHSRPPSPAYISTRLSKRSSITSFNHAQTSNLRPPSPLTPPTASNPIHTHGNSRHQPQNSIDQINPDSILHPLHIRISLCILLDEQLPKYAKERDPQDKQDRVPDERKRDA